MILNVTCHADGGWWEGEFEGKKGWFPGEFRGLSPSDLPEPSVPFLLNQRHYLDAPSPGLRESQHLHGEG